MKRICVFCGSSPGANPEYLKAAERLGEVLVQKNIGLVYGGAKVGIMGRLAETVLKSGGEVIGVIPKALAQKEVAFSGLTDLRIVESMHERKALMAELADGFIAMPGGFGTLEEFFEVVTWAQLGFHQKPCGLLNTQLFFNRLMGFIDHVIKEQFIHSRFRAIVLIHEDPEALLNAFENYQPLVLDKAKLVLELSKKKTS